MHRPTVLLFISGLAGWAETATDGRLSRLEEFFRKQGAPIEHLAQEFLTAADRYGHDWRLLPSLAIIETGGRVGAHNNLFGWGQARFLTIPDGIHTVARRLAEGRAYKGKSLNEKLQVYNPVSGYVETVRRVMRQLRIAPPR